MIQISIRDVALLLAALLKITGTLDQSADAALYSWLCFHVTTLMFVIHQSKTGPTAAPHPDQRKAALVPVLGNMVVSGQSEGTFSVQSSFYVQRNITQVRTQI